MVARFTCNKITTFVIDASIVITELYLLWVVAHKQVRGWCSLGWCPKLGVGDPWVGTLNIVIVFHCEARLE